MMDDTESELAGKPARLGTTGLQSMDCMMGRKPKQKHVSKMEGKSNDKHVKKKRSKRDRMQDQLPLSDGGRDSRTEMVWGGDQWYMVGK